MAAYADQEMARLEAEGRAVEALQEMLPTVITVLPSRRELRQPAIDLVPGDVVEIGEGDQVPADGQLLSAAGLRVDQSAPTGESHPVFKLPAGGNNRASVPPSGSARSWSSPAPRWPPARAASSCARPACRRRWAASRSSLKRRQNTQPALQREMVRVIRLVSVLAAALGTGFFVLVVATGVFPLAEGFLFALGVIVASVPEGLLPTLTLTLALALGVQRMVRNGDAQTDHAARTADRAARVMHLS